MGNVIEPGSYWSNWEEGCYFRWLLLLLAEEPVTGMEENMKKEEAVQKAKEEKSK